MKEQLINFDTAKLAKEKGFNEECFYHYDTLGKLHEPYSENGSSTDTQFRVDLTDLLENFNRTNEISASNQSLLQKWLREEHNIEVYTRSTYKSFDKTKYYTTFVHPIGCLDNYDNTYEEALERGLQQALKLIN